MTLLSCNSQKRLEHRENQTSEPRTQIKILIYQMECCPLQKLWGEWVQALGAVNSGIVLEDKR